MNQRIFFILVFILIGCTSTIEATSNATEEISPTSPSMSGTTSLPTKNLVSSTVSPSATESPSKQTALPHPTWTALPTFSSDSGFQKTYEWLLGGVECFLPCWAGITPGITEWPKAKHLIEPMSGFVKMEYFVDRTCTFGQCNEARWSIESEPDGLGQIGYVYSRLPENKIHLVWLEVNHPDLLPALSIQNILKTYGKPSMLLFSSEPDLPGPKHLEVTMIYEDKQFIIQYRKHAKLNGNVLESCEKENENVISLVVLDNREQLSTLSAISTAIELQRFYFDPDWHKSVEEATNMTMETFYETFSKENTPCIITPINIWQ